MVRKRKQPQKKIFKIGNITYASELLYKSHLLLDKALKDNIIDSFDLSHCLKAKCGKYSAYKPIINTIRFDSMMEGNYYVELLKQVKNKEILNFDRQVSYELLPSFKLGSKKITGIKYVADFVVKKDKNTTIIIDIKGKETTDFKIKKKLFEYKYKKTLFCIQYYAPKDEWLTLEEIKKLKKK